MPPSQVNTTILTLRFIYSVDHKISTFVSCTPSGLRDKFLLYDATQK